MDQTKKITMFLVEAKKKNTKKIKVSIYKLEIGVSEMMSTQ